MKLLITGASGFIGSNLIDILSKQNYEISVITRQQSKIKKFDWFSKIKIYEKNLLHLSKKDYEEFASHDVVIHLAWDGLPNYNDDIHYYNYKLSREFIENIIDYKIKHILIAGTCFEYGMQNGCLTEDQKTSPTNKYGIAKNKLRNAVLNYSKNKKLCVQWARFFYLYGKGQNKNSLIGQLDEKIENREKFFYMSLGDQLRDYLKVKDACNRVSKLIGNDNIRGVVNICSNKPISIEELVTQYIRSKNKYIELVKGYYDYNDYEPMNFWGHSKYFDSLGNIK